MLTLGTLTGVHAPVAARTLARAPQPLHVDGAPAPAEPGVLYGALDGSAPFPGSLLRIDAMTGAATRIGPTGISNTFGAARDSGCGAIAIASSGALYVTDRGDRSNLYRVDAATGAATLVGNTGLSAVDALTFDGFDRLFAVAADDHLYRLDPVTGASTPIGTMGASVRGLAFDPTTRTMWGSGDAGSPDQIYHVDPATGAATLIGVTGLGGATPEVACSVSGTLYGVKRGAGNASDALIAIDRCSAAGSAIGALGFHGVSGLAARAGGANCRWASNVIGFSSQYSIFAWSAGQTIGPPDVYPNYGDFSVAWASLTQDAAREYLELGFGDPAPINFITIYETDNPGAIDTVQVRNPVTGQFVTVWTGTATIAPALPRVFTAVFPETPFPVSDVRISIDSPAVPGWNEIDAVGIGKTDLLDVGQWATQVVDYSSEFGAQQWSAAQVLGAPNAYPCSGSLPMCWASATPDGGPEFLDVAFDHPEPIDFVSVYETSAPGALARIQARNPFTDEFYTVWTGTPAPAGADARIFTASFPETPYKVSELRLEFDSQAVPGWNQVDAIAMGRVACQATLVSVTPAATLPHAALEPARPNPFTRSTDVRFALRRDGPVRLEVFDVTGQRVVRLVDQAMAAGPHQVRWGGRDAMGRTVASGIYYLRLEADGARASRRVVKLQ